jgi:hypothetical protein
MNNQDLKITNDTAYFPASSAYLRPRYPIDPQLSEPLAEALGQAYASTALVSLLILLLSFSLFMVAASVSRRPSPDVRTGQQTVQPAFLTAQVPMTAAADAR